ncbi:MAG: tRNA uridine-5-carboxymethylaminomethyl(34) synthesis enzyme MnmG, partial [Verrucomicrobiales bacterium]|nr:tRNA uridine-5-carboxymethylaminomethyl(34) synthesis enzyme MnmG [Verrucomicrobiales bacterium]
TASKAGLIDETFRNESIEKQATIDELRKILETTHTDKGSLAKWLRRPESSWTQFDSELCDRYSPAIWEQVEIDVKYEGYITRQGEMVAKAKRLEDKRIPTELDYTAITGLKREAQTKFNSVRPITLGQAARISGITPADISLLAVWIERSHRREE